MLCKLDWFLIHPMWNIIIFSRKIVCLSESIAANNVLYVSPGSQIELFNIGGRLCHAVRFCWGNRGLSIH